MTKATAELAEIAEHIIVCALGGFLAFRDVTIAGDRLSRSTAHENAGV